MFSNRSIQAGEHESSKFKLAAAAGVCGLVLFTAACGGGSGESTPPPTEPAPTTAPPTTDPTVEPPRETDPPEEPTPLAEIIIGEWRSDDAGDPYLTFSEDGTMGGSDGCNGVGGEYTVDEEARFAHIERFASTLRACPDINDWLRGTSTVTVDEDGYMQVFDTEMEHIGQLYRAE